MRLLPNTPLKPQIHQAPCPQSSTQHYFFKVTFSPSNILYNLLTCYVYYLVTLPHQNISKLHGKQLTNTQHSANNTVGAQ